MKRLAVPYEDWKEQRFLSPKAYELLFDKFKYLTARGWLEEKLKQAGFDLSKEIQIYKEDATQYCVFIQVEEGSYADFTRDSNESANSTLPTQSRLQTLPWDRVQETIEEVYR